MLCLAPFIAGDVQDQRFVARGAPNHCQGPIGNLPITVKPTEYQDAYFGYKENIEAFLAATALEKVVSVTQPTFVIPELHWTIPIEIPDVTVSFDMTASGMKSLTEAIGRNPKIKTDEIKGIAKHNQAYKLSGLSKQALLYLSKVKRHANSPRIGDTVPIESIASFIHLMNFMELYLRANTYAAFKSDEDKSTPIVASVNIRVHLDATFQR